MADRRGRKLMVVRSCFAIALFIGLMSLVGNVWQFVGLRALLGAFAGFNAATISLVASQVPPRRLGYSLGWLSTGQLVGTLIGPLLGGFVADITGSYQAPFVFTSGVCALCGVLALVLVRERFTPPKTGAGKATLFQGFAILSRSPGLLPLFVVLLLAQFGVQAVQPVVTLYVEQLLGPVPALATLGGLAFSVTGVGDLIASPFLGRRSDVLGYRRVLLIALGGAALASVPQAFVPNYWSFVGTRFALGLFVGGILPTANALVGRLAPAGDRGTVYGVAASAMFLGQSLGPLSGGIIAATLGLQWVFLVKPSCLRPILSGSGPRCRKCGRRPAACRGSQRAPNHCSALHLRMSAQQPPCPKPTSLLSASSNLEGGRNPADGCASRRSSSSCRYLSTMASAITVLKHGIGAAGLDDPAWMHRTRSVRRNLKLDRTFTCRDDTR